QRWPTQNSRPPGRPFPGPRPPAGPHSAPLGTARFLDSMNAAPSAGAQGSAVCSAGRSVDLGPSARQAEPRWSVMACGAILGSFVLAMAVQAGSHVVPDQRLRRGGAGHVAVAGGAIDFSPDVRRMLKFHQRLARKTVDPLPGDLALAVRIACELLNFRFG